MFAETQSVRRNLLRSLQPVGSDTDEEPNPLIPEITRRDRWERENTPEEPDEEPENRRTSRARFRQYSIRNAPVLENVDYGYGPEKIGEVNSKYNTYISDFKPLVYRDMKLMREIKGLSPERKHFFYNSSNLLTSVFKKIACSFSGGNTKLFHTREGNGRPDGQVR